MERRPIILSLVERGTPQFRRFAISDQFLRYFDGEDWTPNGNAALLFSDANLACQEMQRLLLLAYMDRPVRRFRAPVYIDLYASNPVTLDQLATWLVKVAALLIDSPKHGNGPCEGALGLCRINWSELEEIDHAG